jgi:hypothetical protein
MEPITLILTALVTGAAKAAGDAVPDAYKGLKALIQKKFASQPKPEADKAAMVLEEHEKDPETYEAALKKKLTEAGVDKDQEILNKADELMKSLQPGVASVNNSLHVAGDFKGIGNMSGGTANQTIS